MQCGDPQVGSGVVSSGVVGSRDGSGVGSGVVRAPVGDRVEGARVIKHPVQVRLQKSPSVPSHPAPVSSRKSGPQTSGP